MKSTNHERYNIIKHLETNQILYQAQVKPNVDQYIHINYAGVTGSYLTRYTPGILLVLRGPNLSKGNS